MKFNILGTWYNLLGSYIIIEAVNDKSIIGKYHTKVGDAAGIYELKGQVDTDIDKKYSDWWVVLWSNDYGSSDSITAWSGQIQLIDDVETIVTTWLLTSETEEDDSWHSTLIGKDVECSFRTDRRNENT